MNPDDLIVLGFLSVSEPRWHRLVEVPHWMVASAAIFDLWKAQAASDREARRQHTIYTLVATDGAP